MKNIFSLFLCIIFGSNFAFSCDEEIYKNIFNREIYLIDDESVCVEKLQEAMINKKRRLISLKCQPLLDENKNLINKIGDAKLAIAGTIPLTIILTAIDPFFIFGFSGGSSLFLKVEKMLNNYRKDLAKNEEKINNFIKFIDSGPMALIDRHYINQKPNLSDRWQDRIESELEEHYERGLVCLLLTKIYLHDLVYFPKSLGCICQSKNPADFRSALALGKTNISDNLSIQNLEGFKFEIFWDSSLL